ncbi:uncharacterized protein si:ch211-159e12.5 [Puntigrus tetrazona]|uniref:uncharacterized protein si:ch211-159e12.5 n=1 Tax=Puntigrus tetrazona TaxID=1606681 RepID=UPI001C896E13|nr:uncharacterized protein si:ch211-159e12.5 [Puntigrus tetrazona]
MDFLKDPLYAKYSTFPGWHSSHIYQHKPSTSTRLQHLSEYKGSTAEPKTWVPSGTRTTQDIYDFTKQTDIPSIANFCSHTKLSHRELSDYTGDVSNRVPIEKQRSDKGRHAERDQGWENTWPMNYREIRENFGANSRNVMQTYADCYTRTLSKKPLRFESGERRSSRCASDMGSGQWALSPDITEQFQPTALTSQKKDKTELIGEQWWKWSPRNSRNTESVLPVGSFRQPPSYMAPPAYSSPRNGEKRAGTPETSAGAFQESRTVPFTDLTETHPAPNNGHYLQKNDQTQNTERYHSDITDGQRYLDALNTSTVLQYTTINTKPQLQYRESPQMIHPDITRTKQIKLPRRKGSETVFCLVSRMGEVSGLSSSPEEPLKSHVLPLLTDCKPDYKTLTTEQTNAPQHSDDSRHNQDVCLQKDKTVGQLHESLMFGEYGHAPLNETSSSIQDLCNATEPDKNKEELQYYVQGNDSDSNDLAQKSTMQTDGPCMEIIEKFPLWKEPKYQHPSTGMPEQTRNNEPEVSNPSTNEQQSLVLIDATCVVVKVELVLLPEKEHVQYVCLTEENPSPSAREVTEEQKQHSSAAVQEETPENITLDERVGGILEVTHEHPRTSVQTHKSVSEEHYSFCESHKVHPVKEFEQSPSIAATVDRQQEQENKPVLGHSQRETTPESNDGVQETLNIMKVEEQTAAQEPESVLEDLEDFSNAKPTSEKTTIYLNQSTEQGHGLALEDSVVEQSTQKDNENQTDAKDPTEDNLSDDNQELVLDCSTAVLGKSAEHCMKDALAFSVGSRTLRRSSSSPHLSFTSASKPLDVSAISPVVSHTENEPPLPTSFTNPESTQCSGSPSVQTSSPPSPSSTPLPEAFEDSTLPQTGHVPSDVSLCTPSLREQKPKTQHAESLWDAVSRIRRHTAPDSETEDEEQSESADNDLLYQRLNTEEEGESEDNTLEN